MPILDWLNKEEAVHKAKTVPYRLLKPVKKLSYGDPESENMLIQGDNLEALKALLPLYAGEVKCVYVDPPFNTEQAFDHYDDNLEHSIWLSTMYSRFELLNKLLSEEGSFFLHLDDNQMAYAIVICDEIFGRKNRIFQSTFKQSSTSGPKAINPGVVTTASYIVCYAKNKFKWKPNRVFVSKKRDDRYSKYILDTSLREDEWQLISLREAFANYSGVEVNELKRKYMDKYEEKIHEFVLNNAQSVIRTARVADKDVGEEGKVALKLSRENKSVVYRADRDGRLPSIF